MIQKFCDRVLAQKEATITAFMQAAPSDYDALVKLVVEQVADDDDYGCPDVDRITVIDHGDYQGTRLFIIGAKGDQPSIYWSIFVDYGSCSGCDSFEATRDYSDEPPTREKATEYWTMMLHMVQSMRELGKGDDNEGR